MGNRRSSLLAPLLAALLPMLAVAAPREPATEEARALERRLLAPCCYRETLDVHESPSAAALRDEIRGRLRAGEAAQAVEASLVRRHGPKIRATLPGQTGDALAALLFVVSPALLLLAWRRLRRAAPAPPEERPAPRDRERRALEDRLDEDLEALA